MDIREITSRYKKRRPYAKPLKTPRNATIGSVKRIFKALLAMKYISFAASKLPFLCRIFSASGSPAAAFAITTEGWVSGRQASTTAKATPMMILKLAHSHEGRILDIIPPVEAEVFSDGFTDRTADGRADICADNEKSHCLTGMTISEHIGN
jgi:hypothetical protein